MNTIELHYDNIQKEMQTHAILKEKMSASFRRNRNRIGLHPASALKSDFCPHVISLSSSLPNKGSILSMEKPSIGAPFNDMSSMQTLPAADVE